MAEIDKMPDSLKAVIDDWWRRERDNICPPQKPKRDTPVWYQGLAGVALAGFFEAIMQLAIVALLAFLLLAVVSQIAKDESRRASGANEMKPVCEVACRRPVHCSCEGGERRPAGSGSIGARQ